ncbi:MAG: transcriptional repressor LexA [Anaerolineae bacterium]
MIEISEKQEAILAFIQQFTAENGYPPTYEEIRSGLGISSKSLVNYHLAALENAQLISRVPNTPRGIQLRQPGELMQLPLAAALAGLGGSDQPPLSQSDMLELTFNCITGQDDVFALKVSHSAAADDFAQAGDIVILQRQERAQNGELLALKLPGYLKTSFRRYFRENGHVRLKSPNTAQADIIAKPTEVQIKGKVLAVIRQADQA